MNRTKKWSVKGSITVEMAYVFPLVMLVFLFTVYTIFYYHDKNIIIGAAAETAVAAAQEKREKGRPETDWGAFYRERTKGKLIYLRLTSAGVQIEKDWVQVTAAAEKRRMQVMSVQKAGIVRPEKKIRTKRKLEAAAGQEGL